MHETFKAEVISLGRITIPKTIREILGVKDGDIIEVTIHKKVSQSPLAIPGSLVEAHDPLRSPVEAPVNPKGGESN